jgi:imidazolonepropionase
MNNLSCGVVRRATLATMQGDGYGIMDHAAVVWEQGRLVFVGPDAQLPACWIRPDWLSIDAAGALVTPGLIDCHTHLVFAGDRAHEFEQRLNGVSYEAIARAGGGIMATVSQTRAASYEHLLQQSLPRAQALIADGVTTIEIKSGYALDPEGERRILRVARQIGEQLGVCVRTTYLGAHAVPPEYQDRREHYIDQVCSVLPAMASEGLVDAVDVFCERIAFSVDETRRVFDAAIACGLRVKLHADQLSNSGGADLVAAYRGLSADHVEYTDEAGVLALSEAKSVAVLLPGSFYALRETQIPPIAEFRKHDVAMAIASDLNPGTSPLCSLRLAMNMACTLFRLTPLEALRGVTVNAARALDLWPNKGVLQVGADADLVVWNANHPAALSYWMGGHLVSRVIAQGKCVFDSNPKSFV